MQIKTGMPQQKEVMIVNKALVFSIEEFSTFDGPGIRTTVFLKGCPLRCEWCHNPEGQTLQNEIVKAQSGCIGCGACTGAGLRVTGKAQIVPESILVCPNRLLRFAAKEYTAQSLAQKLEKNFLILNSSGGGVTFSGGEPLASAAFLLEILPLLEGRTHRALQTCGYCEAELFKKVLKQTDYVLYDLKLMDAAQHKRYTGVTNEKILNNFEILANSGKEFVVRTPLIPGVTDTVENLTAIAVFLKERGIGSIDLLPYNKMAGGKYASIGAVYEPSFNESVPSQPRTEIFERMGIEVHIL